MMVVKSRKKKLLDHSCTQEENTTIKTMRVFSLLPADVIHHIFLFYVSEYQDLIRLRVINQDWKDCAESSLFWFTLPLVITAPKIYVLYFHNLTVRLQHPQPKKFTAITLASRFGRGSAEHELYDDENYEFTHDDFKKGVFYAVCDPRWKRKVLFKALGKGQNAINRFEESRKVFTWFLQHFRYYHKGWRVYHRELKIIDFITKFVAKNYSKDLVPIVGIIWIGLDLSAAYGFFTMNRNLRETGQIQWENYLSFGCVNLIVFSFFAIFLVSSLQEFCMKLKRSVEIDLIQTLMKVYNGHDIFGGFILQILFTMMIIESAFAFQGNFWFIFMAPSILLNILLGYRINQFWKDDHSQSPIPIQIYAFILICFIIFQIAIFVSAQGTGSENNWILSYPVGLLFLPMTVFSGGLIHQMLSEPNTRRRAILPQAMLPSIGLVLNVLLFFYYFYPTFASSSWMSWFLPPIFTFYLYMNIVMISLG